jgi:protease-4
MTSKRLWILIALASLLGCKSMPPLFTFSQISMKDKIAAEVHVKGVQLEAKQSVVKTVVEGSASHPTIAIVDVDGLLLNDNFTGPLSEGENPVNFLAEKLRTIERDPCVCSVVLRINSPGGGVTASDIMRQELVTFKNRTHLPIIACILDLGTGGGYYLATAGDSIVAHPTSVVGGIGVIVNLYNLADVMGAGNVYSQPIRSGNKIDMGSLLKEIDTESKQLLQEMADEFHSRFEHIVAESRPLLDSRDISNFDGRVFTANEARKRGLVDEIGYLETAIRMASERASVSGAFAVAMYHRPTDTPHSPYAMTPNVPLQSTMLPVSIPGVDRSRLPRFLYLWQPDPTLEKLGGI